MCRHSRVLLAGAAVLAALWTAPAGSTAAEAVAKVNAIVLDVAFQTAGEKSWQKAAIGTRLPSGSRVRTARRSKCEIALPGGSLVRMAPRSELLITSVTGADNKLKLVSGQVLANAVKGSGIQIEGANATVAVQGTWVLFDGTNSAVWDGSATQSAGGGSVTVGDQQQTVSGATTVPLWAGNVQIGTVTASVEQGNVVVTYATSPGWTLAATQLSFGTTPPTDAAIAGHGHPDLRGVTLDRYAIPLAEIGADREATIYIAAQASANRIAPAAAEEAWAEGIRFGRAPAMYFTLEPTAATDTYPWEFATGADKPWWYGLGDGVNVGSTPGSSVGMLIKQQSFASHAGGEEGFFQVPTEGWLDVNIGGGGEGPPPYPFRGAFGFTNLSAAANALGLVQASPPATIGRGFFGPLTQFDLFGSIYTGGSTGYGRARAHAIYRNLYVEIGGQVIGQSGERTVADLSEAFALWRKGSSEVTLGRQHYLEGPVNNTTLGCLFPHLTFDGARLHYEGLPASFDLAWIDRSSIGALPGTDRTQWLGRARFAVGPGTCGATALRADGVGTGASFDFSFPVLPGFLDVYGEVGSDPLKHHIETWGAYWPRLSKSIGLDLFVEYARRGSIQPEWSAIGYLDFRHGWTGVLSVRDLKGERPDFAIGVIKRFGIWED